VLGGHDHDGPSEDFGVTRHVLTLTQLAALNNTALGGGAADASIATESLDTASDRSER
jgi:hypothetical protein